MPESGRLKDLEYEVGLSMVAIGNAMHVAAVTWAPILSLAWIVWYCTGAFLLAYNLLPEIWASGQAYAALMDTWLEDHGL